MSLPSPPKNPLKQDRNEEKKKENSEEKKTTRRKISRKKRGSKTKGGNVNMDEIPSLFFLWLRNLETKKGFEVQIFDRKEM